MPAGVLDTVDGALRLMVNGNGLAYRPLAGEFVREVRQNDDVLRWRMSGTRIRLTFGLAVSANRMCLISSPG